MFLYRYKRQYVAGKRGVVNDRGTAAFYIVSIDIKMTKYSFKNELSIFFYNYLFIRFLRSRSSFIIRILYNNDIEYI